MVPDPGFPDQFLGFYELPSGYHFFYFAAYLRGRPPRYRFFSLVGIIAVSLFTLYRLVTVRLMDEQPWSKALQLIGGPTILHALLFAVYSQVHAVSSWIYLFYERPEVTYIALFVIGLSLYCINRCFNSGFQQTADFDWKISVVTFDREKISDFVGAILLALSCLGAWFLLPELRIGHLTVGDPLDVLNAAYGMLAGAWHGQTSSPFRTWENMDPITSLKEIFSGISIACLLGLLASKRMSTSERFRAVMCRLLPLTYVLPLLLTLSVRNWMGGSVYVWARSLGVVLITFYPVTKLMWGAQDQSIAFRIVAGAADALPFAFAAMIFGEIIGSTKGLGFLAVIAQAEMRIDDAIAISLLVFLIFLTLSLFFRFTAKRLYRNTKEK